MTKKPVEQELENHIQDLIEAMWDKLTLNGRSRVRDQNSKLSSVDLKSSADPEAFTKDELIRPIIRLLDLTIISEKHFKWGKQRRKVDYELKNQKGLRFLLEAKAINSDLAEKSESGAINQVKGIFQLTEARDNYEFGIATDGLVWVFIDKEGEIENEFSITKDFVEIRNRLIGEEKVASAKMDEEITKRFYAWYKAILHGGTYKDEEKHKKSISEKDCIVMNIKFVEKERDREAIAQTLVDRL